MCLSVNPGHGGYDGLESQSAWSGGLLSGTVCGRRIHSGSDGCCYETAAESMLHSIWIKCGVAVNTDMEHAQQRLDGCPENKCKV